MCNRGIATAAGAPPTEGRRARLGRVLRADIPASLVVFLVAVPLSLGIAVASGANHDVRAARVPDAILGPDTVLVCQMEVPAAESGCAFLHPSR